MPSVPRVEYPYVVTAQVGRLSNVGYTVQERKSEKEVKILLKMGWTNPSPFCLFIGIGIHAVNCMQC